ncbi:MAG TPA: hypothetical protein VGG02_09875 [Chthoniobacterales bacterium]|jgi:hypothetical protein
MDDLTNFIQGLISPQARPFINGLLAAVAVLIAVGKLAQPAIAMFHGRRRNQIAQDRLDEALKTTSFWDAWFRAQQSVGSPEEIERAKERVRAELETVLQTLVVPSRPEERAKRLARRSFLRRTFLIYKPFGALGWMLHIAFYFFVVILFFYLLGVFVDPKTNDFSWNYFRAHANASIAPLLIVVIPLLLLHWVARNRRRPEISPA